MRAQADEMGSGTRSGSVWGRTAQALVPAEGSAYATAATKQGSQISCLLCELKQRRGRQR